MQTIAVLLAFVALASAGGYTGYSTNQYVQHAHVAHPVAVAQPAIAVAQPVAVRAAPIAYAQPAVAVRAAPIAHHVGVASYGGVGGLGYGGLGGLGYGGHIGGLHGGLY